MKQQTPAPTRQWRWNGHTVKANTRSEARAVLKRECGLARLPARANVMAVRS